MDATTNGDIKTTSPSGSSNDDCIGITIEAGRARASAAIEARSAGRTVTGAASSIEYKYDPRGFHTHNMVRGDEQTL